MSIEQGRSKGMSEIERGTRMTAKQIASFVSYDPESGEIWWKERPRELFKTQRDCSAWNSRFAGKVTGNLHKSTKSSTLKYKRIRILDVFYEFHRVAFALMEGRWPEMIDHIDGNGLNNQWDNLREVAASENQRNRKLGINNKSGAYGVYFNKGCGKWQASIRRNDKLIHLGTFATFDEALSVRKAAESNEGYTARHGSAA